MIKRVVVWFLGIGFFLLAAGLIFYQPVIRPWHSRWGASDAEAQSARVGDEIITGPADQTTRAIDIHVQAGQVWPWLVQIGQGRGGMFSYDFLENLAGCDIHTLDIIVPELQTLKVGDIIKLGPQEGLPYYRILILEPQKALVMRSVNPSTGEPGETWGFYLEEKSSTLTRLVIRHRSTPSQDATERVVNAIFEPISFVMERGMLYGLRDHAEKRSSLPGDGK